MAVQTLEKPRTIGWEEYLNLPLTTYEIIDGEVIEPATPTLRHQNVLSELLVRLRLFVKERGLGQVFPAPFDLVIRRQPLRTRQPDLFYLSYARAGNLDALLDQSRLEFAPDLVIEVLSPSDTLRMWRDKLHDYYTLGVPEVWLVDIEQGEIEVHVREEHGYSSLGWFSGETPLPSRVLPDLVLLPKTLFESAGEPAATAKSASPAVSRRRGRTG